MVSYCYLMDSKEGYNPPEQYWSFPDWESSEVWFNYDTFKGVRYLVNVSFDNNIGRVKVPLLRANIQGNRYLNNQTTVITCDDDESKSIITGYVISCERVSKDTIELTFAVDWFTSQCLTYWRYNVGVIPTANSILYRRITGGNLYFLDEGFTPKGTNTTIDNLTVTREWSKTQEPEETNLFARHKGDCQSLLVYRDSKHNQTWWLVSNMSIDEVCPETMWYGFSYVRFGLNSSSNIIQITGWLSEYEFNPKNVIFYGFMNSDVMTLGDGLQYDVFIPNYNQSIVPLPIFSVCAMNEHFDKRYREGDVTQQYTTSVGKSMEVTVYFPARQYPKQFERKLIMDMDGSLIYELPVGYGSNVKLAVSYLTMDMSLNMNPNEPALVFEFKPGYISDNGSTFTIPFKPLTYFIDSEQVYNAEEKVYLESLREKQTMDSLISGIWGGATTGAMVFGFSRNGDKTAGTTSSGGFTGIQKGIMGGGVSIAGAMVNAGYAGLYGNKKASEIDSQHARCKADAMLMGNCYSIHLLDKAGFYTVSYDSETVASIKAYQSRYGYASNKVESNKPLNSYTNYVQASVILKEGMRKEVEKYIMDMFENGVWFT